MTGAMTFNEPAERVERLTSQQQAIAQAEIGIAFQAAFLTIAAFAGIGCVLAWSLPLRRL